MGWKSAFPVFKAITVSGFPWVERREAAASISALNALLDSAIMKQSHAARGFNNTSVRLEGLPKGCV